MDRWSLIRVSSDFIGWLLAAVGVVCLLIPTAFEWTKNKIERVMKMPTSVKRLLAVVLLGIIVLCCVAYLKTEARRAEESTAVFNFKKEAQLRVKKLATELREQAAFYKANHKENPKYGLWQKYHYTVDPVIDLVAATGVSTTNIEGICWKIMVSSTFREDLYEKAATEFESLDQQLQPKD